MIKRTDYKRMKELRVAPVGTVVVDLLKSRVAEMKKDLKEAILGIEVTQFDGQRADLEELVNPEQLEKIINVWVPEVLPQELEELRVAPVGTVVVDLPESGATDITEYYWYYCKNKAQADVVFSNKRLRLYGYIKEPEYKVIERYDLRFMEFGSLAAIARNRGV